MNNRKEASVEVDGKQYTSGYFVKGKVITVEGIYGVKSTQLGGSPAETLARMLLRELVGKYQDNM